MFAHHKFQHIQTFRSPPKVDSKLAHAVFPLTWKKENDALARLQLQLYKIWARTAPINPQSDQLTCIPLNTMHPVIFFILFPLTSTSAGSLATSLETA